VHGSGATFGNPSEKFILLITTSPGEATLLPASFKVQKTESRGPRRSDVPPWHKCQRCFATMVATPVEGCELSMSDASACRNLSPPRFNGLSPPVWVKLTARWKSFQRLLRPRRWSLDKSRRSAVDFNEPIDSSTRPGWTSHTNALLNTSSSITFSATASQPALRKLPKSAVRCAASHQVEGTQPGPLRWRGDRIFAKYDLEIALPGGTDSQFPSEERSRIRIFPSVEG